MVAGQLELRVVLQGSLKGGSTVTAFVNMKNFIASCVRRNLYDVAVVPTVMTACETLVSGRHG